MKKVAHTALSNVMGRKKKVHHPRKVVRKTKAKHKGGELNAKCTKEPAAKIEMQRAVMQDPLRQNKSVSRKDTADKNNRYREVGVLFIALCIKKMLCAWALVGAWLLRVGVIFSNMVIGCGRILKRAFAKPLLVWPVIILFLIIPLGGFLSLAFVTGHYWNETSSFRLDEVKDMAYTTLVYDRNGELIQRLFDEYRLSIDDEDIPQYMKQAVIATEDQRFYEHSGVDFIAITRAVIGNLQKSRIQSGASTITQQLARNTVSMFERTYDRKLKEMFMAFRVEQVYTKEEILNLYLNRIYFGRNMYGIGAAADGYFSKHPADMTLAECALLAGIISAPNSASPWFHPDRAMQARHTALSRMLEQGYITQEDYEEAKESPLKVQPIKKLPGSYVISALKNEMPKFLSEKDVFQGGLKIYTTIDLRLQKIAEEEVEKGCLDIESIKYFKHPKRADFEMPDEGGVRQTDYLQGAFVAIKNDDGGVLSVVGGRSYEESNFNRAILANRQVGSSIKPFVYTHAFNMLNMTAFTEIDQTPFDLTLETDWPLPLESQGIGDYLSVREALRTSNNYCAMRAGLAAGKEDFAFLMKQLTETEVPPFQSSFLGACEVTPFNMVSAYTVFPNYGRLIKPHIIDRIEDAEGRVIYEHQDDRKQVLSSQVSFQINHLMQEVVNRGTGAAIKSKYGVTGQIGGKTGTTNDYRDCWFVGFSSSITAGVWVGFDEPKEIMTKGYSSRIAVPIWGNIMKKACEMYGVNEFEAPSGVRMASRGVRVLREVVVEPARQAKFLFFDLGWRERRTRVIEKIVDSPDAEGQQEYIREDQAYRALARLDSVVQNPAMVAMNYESLTEQEALGKTFSVVEPQYDYFDNQAEAIEPLELNPYVIMEAVPVEEDTEVLQAPRAVPVE